MRGSGSLSRLVFLPDATRLLSCIFQVFRKYSHSLGPDALAFLDDILARHEIADDDVESSVETLAQEYNKQDGT